MCFCVCMLFKSCTLGEKRVEQGKDKGPLAQLKSELLTLKEQNGSDTFIKC